MYEGRSSNPDGFQMYEYICAFFSSRKALLIEREVAKFDGIQREVGMLNDHSAR